MGHRLYNSGEMLMPKSIMEAHKDYDTLTSRLTAECSASELMSHV